MEDEFDEVHGLAFVEGYRPGVLAEVVALHMAYYAPVWNFGVAFEAKVAGELAAFLGQMTTGRDLLLCARDPQGGALSGAIAVEGPRVPDEPAHLRWFIVAEGARGRGLGRVLLDRALAFCDGLGIESSYLTTFAGLDPARNLYEQSGFRLVATSDSDQWNGGVVEQRFERTHPTAR